MGAPQSERKKGLSPVKCSQTSVEIVLRGCLLTEKSSLYGVVRQTNKTLTTLVTTTSSTELLLQRPSQIVAMREGDKFVQSVISTFLSCLNSLR